MQVDKLFLEYFSKEELKEIFDKSSIITEDEIIITTIDNMYLLFASLEKVTINSVYENKFLDKKEFFKRIRTEKTKEMGCIKLDI
jgi:hypothetical protein